MVKATYEKAYNKCLNNLMKDFKIHRANRVLIPGSNYKYIGSNYNYLAKIGSFYFTHRDFAQALVSGEHGFYAFDRDSALKYIKKHKKNKYDYYKHCKYLEFKENNIVLYFLGFMDLIGKQDMKLLAISLKKGKINER